MKHIRNIKSSDPKMYWDYLKDKKPVLNMRNEPDCITFAEMFKDLGEDNENSDNSFDVNKEQTNFLNFPNFD